MTPIALFRLGNAISARMEHVRPKDIETFESDGKVWVRAGTGGISTSSFPGPLRGHWWRLAAGYDPGALLIVWNDYDGHWSWEPVEDMPLDTFQTALGSANAHFVKA